MEFLKQNPLIFLILILVILAFLARIISKPSPKKKVENKQSDKKEKETEKIVPIIDDTSEKIVESEPEKIKKKEKKKLKRLKPEITRVYEKKELQPTDDTKTKIFEEKNQKEEEILKSMQFVKSSKNVERLKPLTMNEIEEREKMLLEQDMAFQDIKEPEVVEEKPEEKKKVVYFDKSRRLSKMIKNDSFDDMFCSHISDKYMNMDEYEKHLKNCEELQTKLFNRVAETVVNSEIRFSNNEDGVSGSVGGRNNMTSDIERRRRETVASFLSETKEPDEVLNYDDGELIKDKIDLSARNILVVDAISKRKGVKK